MKKEYEEKINNQQERIQHQHKASTVKTAEDEIFLNQLKGMDEARESIVIFPEDIRAVGLEVQPFQIIRIYNSLIDAAENPSAVPRETLREEIKENLRGHPADRGVVFKVLTGEVYISFQENQYPLEVLRKLFRNPKRIVVRARAERYPTLEKLEIS